MAKLTGTDGAGDKGAAIAAVEIMENKIASVTGTVNARQILFVLIG
jgi:hypothetical protein